MKLAVVPVFDRLPSDDLIDVSSKIKGYLQQEKRFNLVPEHELTGYFLALKSNDANLTKGEQDYEKAEALYYEFENEKSLAILERAISELIKNPGKRGSLIQAYLLKVVLYWELGKQDQVFGDLGKVAALNLDLKELDAFYYSPNVRDLYKKAYNKFVKSNVIVDMTLKVKGSRQSPVYVNGVLRGYSPDVVVRVPQNKTQIVSVGNVADASQISVDPRQGRIVIDRKYNQFDPNKIPSIGFHDRTDQDLFYESLKIGNVLHLDRVILVLLEEKEGLTRMKIRVVDVKRIGSTKTKPFDVTNLHSEMKELIRLSSDYIASLGSKDFFRNSHGTQDPILIGRKSKPFIKSKLGMIVLGAFVVGAGTAIGLGISSSGSSDPDPSSATISGPLPGVPGS